MGVVARDGEEEGRGRDQCWVKSEREKRRRGRHIGVVARQRERETCVYERAGGGGRTQRYVKWQQRAGEEEARERCVQWHECERRRGSREMGVVARVSGSGGGEGEIWL